MSEVTSSEPETGETHHVSVRLLTDRPGVELREMTSHDEDKEYLDLQLRNKDHITEYGNVVDASLEEVTARRTRKGMTRFGIYEEDILVGAVEFTPNTDGTEAEVGIVLDQDATGRGLAVTALRAATDYVSPRFDRVFAEIDEKHDRSIRMCENVGYIRQPGVVVRDWGRAVVMEYPKPPSTSLPV